MRPAPCEWVNNLDAAVKRIKGPRRLLYLYFYKHGYKRTGNFKLSKDMQRVSREKLVFVDVPYDKKKSPAWVKDLYKRCKVKRLPAAVIADRHGNPLLQRASTESGKALRRQASTAEATEKKLQTGIKTTFDKAKDRCRQRQFASAAALLYGCLKKGHVGYPGLKEMKSLLSKINTYHEKKLAKILTSSETTEEKQRQLASLKASTYNRLPAYKKITAAFRN